MTNTDTTEIRSKQKLEKTKNQKVIFLNNEVIENNLSAIDEANNDLLGLGDDIIELKEEIKDEKDQKIIQLIEEVDDIINLN